MAENKNTGFKRATSAVVTNFEGSGSLLNGNNGIASSSTVGGVIILEDFNFNIPAGSTIEGITVQSKIVNEGSSSLNSESFADVSVTARVGEGNSFNGTLRTLNIVSESGDTVQTFNFGSTTTTEGRPWTSNEANALQLRFEYASDDNVGFNTSQSIAISGSQPELIPAVRIYYRHTPDIDYTREVLRNGTTSSQVFDSNDKLLFELNNNSSTTAYFNIEGEKYWDGSKYVYKNIFDIASAYDLSNCTVVSESAHAAFIVEPNITGQFKFLPTEDIQKNEIKFIASNNLNISGSTKTFKGIGLGVSSVI